MRDLLTREPAARIATASALAVGAAAVLLAWWGRFVQDDAFIAFQYARSLAEGRGLGWFGERVEGYTDFLWVLWLALGVRLGADPIGWSQTGGLAAFALALHAVWNLGRFLYRDAVLALAVLSAFAAIESVRRFATGGLETMLQTACLAQSALQLARASSASCDGMPRLMRRHLSAMAAWLGAAVLTRPDSALAAIVLTVVALRVAAGSALRLRDHLAWLAPGVVPVLVWLVWKLAYYGDVLPNTYYAKTAWNRMVATTGAVYLGRFFGWYGFAWLWAACGVVWLTRRARRSAASANRVLADHDARFWTWVAIGAWLGSWLVYLVAIGGDFMEFRMLVPVAPALVLATGGFARAAFARFGRPAMWIMTLIVAALSVHHARSFRGLTPDHCLDSVPALATFYQKYPDGDFTRIGSPLGTQLRGSDAFLALHAVGAIPYYSRLRTLDMYGLNDREVARHGRHAPPVYKRPGHQRQVTIEEMQRRGVNLVIGDPTIIKPGVLTSPEAAQFLAEQVHGMVSFGPAPTGGVSLVAIPLARNSLLAWYLTPSPAIDAAAAANGWERCTLELGRRVVRPNSGH